MAVVKNACVFLALIVALAFLIGCVSTAGLEPKQEKDCDSLKNSPDDYYFCLHQLAESKADPSYCSKIPSTDYGITYVDCYSGVALAKNDFDACKLSEFPNLCYEGIAYRCCNEYEQEHYPSGCAKIKTMGYNETC